MITGPQIRAARALLNWSAGELARRARLGSATVQRAEAASGIPMTQAPNLHAIQMAFEQAGIVFLEGGHASPGGGPGLRLRGIGRPTR